MKLEKLIEKDNEVMKSFVIDITITDSIVIKNCANCLFNCCDNLSNKKFDIPLTEKEMVFLNRKYVTLPPNPLVKDIDRVRLDRIQGIPYNTICEFSSSKGCTLKDKRPLHCKIFPFLFFNNEIILHKDCFCHKNSSMEDIRKGARIAKELFSQESTSYLETTNKINTKDRERFLEIGEDYIFTGIFL
jgi:hypothetical protein